MPRPPRLGAMDDRRRHVRTPLDNLHMAGHFTVWPGAVPTAALSGKIAALRAWIVAEVEAEKSRAPAEVFTQPPAAG